MKRLPMLRLPRSLFGRNVLLMVALIALAELGIGVLFRQMMQEPRLARQLDFVQAHAEATRTVLLSMTPAARERYLAQLGIPAFGPQHPANLVDTIPDQLRARQFIDHLGQRLGRDYRLRWQETPVKHLWAATLIDGHAYWFELDSSAFTGSITPLIVIFAIGAGLLSLLGAYLLQRRINRPLTALTAAVGALGRGQRLPIDLRDAPTEIAQLGASFNQMASNLESAEQERVLMLAGVSHDLRTPLTKLRLVVEMLADSNDPDLIASMVRNIAAANAVIGQFIDYARIGNDEPEALCDLNAMLVELAQEFGAVLEADDNPNLYCHPLALRRALINLLENAARYGRAFETGGDNSQAMLLRSMWRDDCLMLSVLDRGPGIAEQDIERMRQPFARLDQARSGAPGAGLGLAIVERIARLHRGRLLLENRDGGGFQASLLLPCRGKSF